MRKLYKSRINEEYGKYQGMLDEIADDLERGYTSGSGYNEDGDYTWYLTVNGEKLEDLLQTPEMRDWVCYEISYPVKDGHDVYGGLDILFNNYSYTGQIDHTKEEVIEDLITLGFDEDYVRDMAKTGNAKSGDINDITEIETWIDYDIHYAWKEYDEEDETEMNNIEECVGGMASTGTAPSPAVGHVSAATVNGKAIPSKSSKKKSLKELTEELKNLLK